MFTVVDHQNESVTPIFTNFALGLIKDFNVGLSLIGSKEMISSLGITVFQDVLHHTLGNYEQR